MLAASLAAISTLGCGSAGPVGEAQVEESAEDLTAVQSGLWALEGSARGGDIELLQLGRRDHASLVREVAPARAAQASSSSADAMGTGAGVAPSPPPPAVEAVAGDVSRGTQARAPKLTLDLDGAEKKFEVKTVDPDTMTLTEVGAVPARVLTYKRSYRLYCVPSDPGTESTMLIEMGATPKIIGVNGDGKKFPRQGDFDAAVRADELFRLQDDYVVTSRQPATANRPASTITVTLPWSEMTKPSMKGKVAITGTSNAVPATAMICERVTTP